MKLIIEIPDDALRDAQALVEWARTHAGSDGEIVRIGSPHGKPAFAWRILSMNLML